MAITKDATIEDLKDHIARRISEYSIGKGTGAGGRLQILIQPSAARTFRAHWTGFKLVYGKPTIVIYGALADGSFWAEGYISTEQPSYVLAFRKTPHKSRGTGAERPDDKLATPQSIEIALAQRHALVESGAAADEEIIRYEDFDSPTEAIDQFFNYTAFYCLKAVDGDWTDFSFEPDPSIGWDDDEKKLSGLPIDAAMEEGLKKSDILWLTVDSDGADTSVPCWFVYTKDKRIFVLSGEEGQIIPNATKAVNAHVALRWKGRDAQLAEFEAGVRAITAVEDKDEFVEIAKLLVAKRQSVRGTIDETIKRWMREAVILELIPRN